MKYSIFIISLFMLALSLSGCGQKQKNYLNESESAKKERMAWWDDAKFGMFIHWGIYAVPAGEYKGEKVKGGGEWIMNSLHIPIKEYEQFAKQFDPQKFDANQWVSIAKNAGMKYMVITSKHHDGFCLWDTKYTNYNVVDATPFHRDIIKELSEACKKQGMRFGVYYSIMDWHHPDAQGFLEPDYNSGNKTGKTNPEFTKYVNDYMKPQLKELLTKYDNIDVLWFDGEWIPDYKTEMGKDLYNYLRNIKPSLIINNRIDKGRRGMSGLNSEGDFAGDFGTPEQEIPATGIPGAKWESCMTMNDTWGYKSFDNDWKSSETLIRNLIDVVSKGGNLLLNVGPTAEGLIPQPSVERLQDIGSWLDKNGEAIYGAAPSPVDKPDWGRYTAKDNRIFACIFDWPSDDKLSVAGISGVQSARFLSADNQEAIPLDQGTSSFTLQLPEQVPDTIATVVVLEK